MYLTLPNACWLPEHLLNDVIILPLAINPFSLNLVCTILILRCLHLHVPITMVFPLRCGDVLVFFVRTKLILVFLVESEYLM